MPKRRLKIIIPATIIATATPAAFGICHFFDQSSITPKITISNTEWTKKAIISIESAASFTSDTLDHYEYCISDNSSSENCAWRSTTDSQISIINAGTSYVRFRGISSRNFITAESNTIKVLIDREKPEAETDITTDGTDITVAISATDKLSGIESYYYALDDSEYIAGSQAYTFQGLATGRSYRIKTKIVDNAGNTKYLTSGYTIVKQSSDKQTMNHTISTSSTRGKSTSIKTASKNTTPSKAANNTRAPKSPASKTSITQAETLETPEQSYTIAFELAGGTLPEDYSVPDKYEPGDIISLTNPQKDGYVFKAWHCNAISEDAQVESDIITDNLNENLIFTAIWEPIISEQANTEEDYSAAPAPETDSDSTTPEAGSNSATLTLDTNDGNATNLSDTSATQNSDSTTPDISVDDVDPLNAEQSND